MSRNNWGNNIRGFEVHVQHLEIAGSMDIDVLRCLLKIKEGWLTAKSIRKIIPILVAVFTSKTL